MSDSISISSSNLNKKVAPRFDVINRYQVTILSLRNKLRKAKGIDELTNIASKIIELENQILLEKTAGYKDLEEEKKLIVKKIKKLNRTVRRANDELERVDNTLENKIHGYKKKLEERIAILSNEYQKTLGNKLRQF